jgi:hypothetical protein
VTELKGGILLRCFKRRAAAETGPDGWDAESLYAAEFRDHNGRPDTELSVYDIDADDWCGVFLRRAAAAGIDPPRCAGGVDVRPIRSDAEAAPEDWCFRVLTERHRILRFESDQVLPFVIELHCRMRDGTCSVFRHERSDLRTWLRANKDDAEWAAFLAGAKPKWVSESSA